jgi:hypothetical protein
VAHGHPELGDLTLNCSYRTAKPDHDQAWHKRVRIGSITVTTKPRSNKPDLLSNLGETAVSATCHDGAHALKVVRKFSDTVSKVISQLHSLEWWYTRRARRRGKAK